MKFKTTLLDLARLRDMGRKETVEHTGIEIMIMTDEMRCYNNRANRLQNILFQTRSSESSSYKHSKCFSLVVINKTLQGSHTLLLKRKP